MRTTLTRSSSQRSFALLLALFMVGALVAQINYTQDFEGCDDPATCNGWTVSGGGNRLIGPTSSGANNYSACDGASAGVFVRSADPAGAVTSGILGTSSGAAATLDFSYKCVRGNGTSVAASVNIDVQYSTDGSSWTTISSFLNESGLTCIPMTGYSFTPGAALPVQVRFNLTWQTGGGNNWVVFDAITLTQGAGSPCAGTPDPGNTLTTDVSPCSGADFTLSAQNETPGNNITYQWQSSTAGPGGPFANNGLGTVATQLTSTMVPTWYQVIVTCAGSPGTSIPVAVAPVQTAACYCIPTANTNNPTGITNVTLNTIDNTTTTGTTPATSYWDFTAQSTTLYQGMSYTLSARVNTSGAFTAYAKAWIDWDHNGVFDDPAEAFNLGSVTDDADGATSLTATITIPGNALPGPTVMRVRAKRNNDPIPCGNQNGSETEDYTVDVQPDVPCTNPGVGFNLVEDCSHRSYSVEMDVYSTGNGPFVRATNSLSLDTLTNIFAGITTVGPFPMDSTVSLTVMSGTNNLCRVFSPAFVVPAAACVYPICAAEAYEYCYSNNDTAWFSYQGTENVPVTLEFLWGQLLVDDYVQVFNGLTATPAQLLWQGNQGGNLTGLAINSTNADHNLLMRIVSNGSHSCATGDASLPLHWVVQCGAVDVQEVPAADLALYPNPTSGQLTIELPPIARGAAEMRIVDIAGRIVHQEAFQSMGGVNTFDLNGLQSGNYTVMITTQDWVKTQRLQIVH